MLLIVWDIDGTLLDAAGAGHRALVRAVETVVGHSVNLAGLDYAGRPDRALIEEALARAGGHPGSEWPLVREHYTRILHEELAETRGRVMPGVEDLLDAVADDPRLAQVLGTGNLEAGAWIKLGHFGLARYFATGGFGDTHRTRPPILRDAVASAARHFERTFDRIVVVGDTPRDGEAAKALGLDAVLVATGRFSRQALTPLGYPVLDDLSSTRGVLALLHGLERGLA
jgi:phosphoglycolate phosphatase